CPSESLSDWIGMHTNLFKYLGGVPKFVVCDNLKAAVTNPDRYDPGLNRTDAEMAGHYGTAILAARPRRPKDKAKVEVAVQIAQRWILARLRNQRFFSLAELNTAIGGLGVEPQRPPARGSLTSTPARCAFWAPAAPNCSPRSIVSSWERCRTSPTSLRAGSVAASPPTITSRSTAIGIPPRTASSGNSSRCASLTRPSRSFTRARESRATPVRPAGAATPRLPIICRA